MASGFVKTTTEVHVVSASGTITLRRPALAIAKVVFLNGGATSISAQTGTVTTATSSVSNAFAFTGTDSAPSATITANSSLGTDSLVAVEYVAEGDEEANGIL